MKKQIICLTACLILAACNNNGRGDNGDVSLGVGLSGYSSRFVKMDPHARDFAHDYLAALYKQQCAGKKTKHHSGHHPDACKLDRPFLTNGSIPVGTPTYPLPQDVMEEIGFVPPGTSYVRAGYAVYLVHWPDKIILDSVSLRPYWKESLR